MDIRKSTWVVALLVFCATAPALEYTENEQRYLPVLRDELVTNWPEHPPKSIFAAQVMQETCSSLRSVKCWSPTAELKTDREYGFGLGQLTITPRFNNFKEAQKLHPSLAEWRWDNRYSAAYQLRTMVLMDKVAYDSITWADVAERMAFALAAYNGGLGGVLSDRAACIATEGCDPSLWFGNVEYTSRKAKVRVGGYGKSFFEINREYVRNIIGQRRDRYIPYFGE